MKSRIGRECFTLIEMLMVIIIIFMLSLLVFRLMTIIDNRTKVAQTVKVLKQLQNALNEYKIEYGIYPPVGNVVKYEYECPTGQTAWFRTFLEQHNDPSKTNMTDPEVFWTDRGAGCPGGADEPPRKYGEIGYTGAAPYPGEYHMHFQYGLVAHLAPRKKVNHWCDEDTERDKEAKKKWAPFMEGLVSGGGGGVYDVTDIVGTRCVFSNSADTIKDGFGGEVKYECYAPYVSYQLWADTPAGRIDSASVGGL